MKIRQGFVSNSSSSSFIIINELNGPIDNGATLNNDVLIVGMKGKKYFGWEQEKSYDFNSKLNFAYLQLLYISIQLTESRFANDPKHKKRWKSIYDKSLALLEKVLKRTLRIDDIEYLLRYTDYSDDEYEYSGYIDHQSTYYECGSCFEMFKNFDTLRNFLFNPESYIETDNDNH